jgi:nucleoside-diphosphate-sugar epimerase
MTMRFSRVLVTGASGFLGRSVVPRLAREGVRVTALGQTCAASPFDGAVEYLTGDLTQAPVVSRLISPWRWDGVVHLAGPVLGKAPESADFALHVAILKQLVRAVPQSWPGRWIHASTMAVYGMPKALPLREEDPRAPMHAYAFAKVAAEDYLMNSAPTLSDLWILRLPGLFSATRREGALYRFVQSALAGVPLRVTAAAPLPWDILHVDDAAEAVVRALASSESNPGAVNISYGEAVDLGSIARRIASIGGADLAVINEGGANHPLFQMDISKARRLLNWPPCDLTTRLSQFWERLSQRRADPVRPERIAS